MKKGFTLVELSVVLVIIGLLIGGILVGKSMMQTAKIEGLIRNLGQYQVAVGNFKQTFRYYPGDEPNFTPPGNHDGFVESDESVTCNGIYSGVEKFQVFAQLSESKMIDQNYVPYTPGGSGSGPYSCGGTQSIDVYGAMAGIIAPYTEVSQAANSFFSRSGTKSSIFFQNTTSNGLTAKLNPFFSLFVDPWYVLPLEAKLSGSGSAQNFIGISNNNGTGKCGSNLHTTVSCTDAAALYTTLSYSFPK